jgi:hypothetical protein
MTAASKKTANSSGSMDDTGSNGHNIKHGQGRDLFNPEKYQHSWNSEQ